MLGNSFQDLGTHQLVAVIVVLIVNYDSGPVHNEDHLIALLAHAWTITPLPSRCK